MTWRDMTISTSHMLYSDALKQLFHKINRRPGITVQCDTVESSETLLFCHEKLLMCVFLCYTGLR